MNSRNSSRAARTADTQKIVVSSRTQAAQAELLPLTVVATSPRQVRSADATCFVFASDGYEYLIKTDKDQGGGMAAEWVTHKLANAVNINVAEARVIELTNGQLVFGSRMVQTINDEVTTANLLIGPTMPGMSNSLSRILALDLFVCNVDRHDGNFLSRTDNAGHSLYAIDHTRSLFWHGEYDVDLPVGTHTIQRGRERIGRHGLDIDAATDLLDKIARLPSDWADDVLRSMPSEWLVLDQRVRFSAWWENGGRSARVARLRKGLIDGTLP
ncbi:MAG: HipA family kinase [Beijerinckiaceae bacterium]